MSKLVRKNIFPNGSNYTVPEALRYYADPRNERPTGGEERFNSIHLYQLADEIDEAAKNARPPLDVMARHINDAVEAAFDSAGYAGPSHGVGSREGRDKANTVLIDRTEFKAHLVSHIIGLPVINRPGDIPEGAVRSGFEVFAKRAEFPYSPSALREAVIEVLESILSPHPDDVVVRS